MITTGSEEHEMAVALNDERRADATTKFTGIRFTSSGVSKLFPDIEETELSGLYIHEVDGVKQYPAWQFDIRGIRPDLPQLRTLLGDYAPDAITADRVMYRLRSELGGLSILQALDSKDLAARTTAHVILKDLGGGQ